ncbi:MAG: preprotein translocase subunit SecE [Halanaerobiaceae bacterium]
MAKTGVLQKIARFFRQVKGELKKVNWPNREEVKSYTLVVIFTVVVLIVFVGLVDMGFSNIITPFIM